MATDSPAASAPIAALIPGDYLTSGISLSQLFAILKAYLKPIAGVALVAMLVSGVLSKFVLQKTYDATATVLVDYEVNSPDVNREFPSLLANSYMTTQTAFIGGPAVLGPVVDQLGWAARPEKAKGYNGAAAGLREYLIWKRLSKNLRIGNPRDSRLISISYSADSADEAAAVANAVANTYVNEHAERMRAPAKARANEYLKSVDELKKRLDLAQVAVSEFRRKTGLIDLTGTSNVEEERLRELNSALLQAEADRRNASIRQRQVSRLRRNSGEADVELTASPGVVKIKDDLLTAQARFAELRKRLGPKHPDYLVAEAAVNELQAKLSREISGFSGGVVSNAGAAASESGSMVTSLRERINEERAKLLEVREQQDEGARLLSELEAAQKLYTLALDSYGQIVRNADSQYSNVSLVSPATAPAKHTKPLTSVNLLLGLIGGLLCATLAALFWEFTHRRVRCVDDLRQELGAPPLAVLGSGK